jgi:hypothetical protein
MPRIPRRTAAAANPNVGALGLPGMAGMPGMPGMPGMGTPTPRKPTRGALGGAAPRGARMRLPPTVAPATRGGKKRSTPKRKVSK